MRGEDLEGGRLHLELVAPRVVHAARARGPAEDEHLPVEEAGAVELPGGSWFGVGGVGCDCKIMGSTDGGGYMICVASVDREGQEKTPHKQAH